MYGTLVGMKRIPRRIPPLCALIAIMGISACTPDAEAAGRLYLTSGFTDQVFVVSAADGRLLDSLDVDIRVDEVDEPHGVAVAPDGNAFYVTVSHGEPSVWKFSTATHHLLGSATLAAPGAARVRVSPDGGYLLIPDYWRSGEGRESGLVVLNTETMLPERRVVLCAAPHDASISPDGRFAVVTCSLSDEIVVLSLPSMAIHARFATGATPVVAGQPLDRPLNAAWAPDGERFYVTLAGAGEVGVFTPSGEVLGRISVGAAPAQLAVGVDGTRLITANRGDATVSVVDLTADTTLFTIDLAPRTHPHGVALDEARHRAFVTYEGSIDTLGGVVALDLLSGQVLWSRELGFLTLGVAWGPAQDPAPA